MKDQRFLFGILTGVGLALLVAILVSVNQPRVAYGEGGPGQAGNLTVVTAHYQTNQDVLYVVDSQQEVIMTYVLWGPGSGEGTKALKKLQLLAVRSIKWDKRLVDYGGYGEATEEKVRKGVLQKMDKEDDAAP